ncbi:MAG: c-type cytochrome [Flavipsychrobacter sp.]|nr:c-type cytochrome [Flavipsychrobacter sp.]
MLFNKKMLVVSIFCTGILVIAQSFAPKDHDEKPVNLKVLPKDISNEELHNIMRSYSLALGVRCGFCHTGKQIEGQQRMKMDFAADDKHEKIVAREMMKMTAAINANYIDKMPREGRALEQITCVTCHNGRTTPIVSADSLVKKEVH